MKDWKSIVNTIAPGIATALGGPLAGVAVRAASQALLGREDGTEEEISGAVLGASPEQLRALKEAEMQFKKDMKALDVDLERIHQEDRSSARQREMAVNDRAPFILALIVTAGFFAALAALIFIEIPEGNKAIVFSLVGSLGTAWIGAMVYYHGSTKQSAEKTRLMADIQKP